MTTWGSRSYDPEGYYFWAQGNRPIIPMNRPSGAM